jgi:hypothetical protein
MGGTSLGTVRTGAPLRENSTGVSDTSIWITPMLRLMRSASWSTIAHFLALVARPFSKSHLVHPFRSRWFDHSCHLRTRSFPETLGFGHQGNSTTPVLPFDRSNQRVYKKSNTKLSVNLRSLGPFRRLGMRWCACNLLKKARGLSEYDTVPFLTFLS